MARFLHRLLNEITYKLRQWTDGADPSISLIEINTHSVCGSCVFCGEKILSAQYIYLRREGVSPDQRSLVRRT